MNVRLRVTALHPVPEIFEKKTLKRLDSVFDLEEQKSLIRAYVEAGEWFTVAGLRRTGKTTLVRSVVHAMGVPSVYLNVWEMAPSEITVRNLMSSLLEGLSKAFRGRIRSVGERIREVTIFGIRISLSGGRVSEGLTEVIGRVIESRGRLVLIIDEVQELGAELAKFVKYLGALHDIYAPRLVVILLGSVVSLKNILGRIRGTPLRGRITKEVILQPFDQLTAVQYLKRGFQEAGISVPDDVLTGAVQYLGGFPGWLAEFGRTFIIRHCASGGRPDAREVLLEVYREAREAIYEELAKLVLQRRKLLGYIKVLRHIAVNVTATPSEVAKVLGVGRNTAHKYLKYLHERAVLGSENGRYFIIDPLIRRAVSEPDAEDKILGALRKFV